MAKLKRLKRLAELRREASERRQASAATYKQVQTTTRKVCLARINENDAAEFKQHLTTMNYDEFRCLVFEEPPQNALHQFARNILCEAIRKSTPRSSRAAVLAQLPLEQSPPACWPGLRKKILQVLEIAESRHSFEPGILRTAALGIDLPPFVTYVKPGRKSSSRSSVSRQIPGDNMRPMSEKYDMPEYDFE